MNKIQAAKTIIKLAKALAKSDSARIAGAKFELTDETKQMSGHTLYRVKYADGTIGGWVEFKSNLQGNAKLLDESCVVQKAVVKGNAVVTGKSWINGKSVVCGNAQIKNSAVLGIATVKDHAVVADCSEVKGNISKSAKVLDHSTVDLYSEVTDKAILKNCEVARFCHIGGSTVALNSTLDFQTKTFDKSLIQNSTLCSTHVEGGIVDQSHLHGEMTVQGTADNCDIESVYHWFLLVPKGKTIQNLHKKIENHRLPNYSNAIPEIKKYWK